MLLQCLRLCGLRPLGQIQTREGAACPALVDSINKAAEEPQNTLASQIGLRGSRCVRPRKVGKKAKSGANELSGRIRFGLAELAAEFTNAGQAAPSRVWICPTVFGRNYLMRMS